MSSKYFIKFAEIHSQDVMVARHSDYSEAPSLVLTKRPSKNSLAPSDYLSALFVADFSSDQMRSYAIKQRVDEKNAFEAKKKQENDRREELEKGLIGP